MAVSTKENGDCWYGTSPLIYVIWRDGAGPLTDTLYGPENETHVRILLSQHEKEEWMANCMQGVMAK